MSNLRKIDLMYRQFGHADGHICKDCSNLESHFFERRYYKCRVYGCSASEATDWKISNPACGMFNKEWTGGRIVELVGRSGMKNVDNEIIPLPGQISLEDFNNERQQMEL